MIKSENFHFTVFKITPMEILRKILNFLDLIQNPCGVMCKRISKGLKPGKQTNKKRGQNPQPKLFTRST